MGRQPSLSPEMAYKVKEDMWSGMEYKEVMAKYNISYQLCVDIKGGRRYEYVPWPDTSTGGMAETQVRKLMDARRFGHAANQALTGHRMHSDYVSDPDAPWNILKIPKDVWDREDAKLKSTGHPGGILAVYTKLAAAMMRMSDLERDERNRQASIAYEKRSAFYDSLSDEEKIEYKKKENGGVVNPFKKEHLPDDQCDPDANEKLDWETVLLLAEKLEVVKIAQSDTENTEPALKLAIQIVFKIFTQRQWKEDHILKMIYLVKAKIERFWEVNPDRAPSAHKVEPIAVD